MDLLRSRINNTSVTITTTLPLHWLPPITLYQYKPSGLNIFQSVCLVQHYVLPCQSLKVFVISVWYNFPRGEGKNKNSLMTERWWCLLFWGEISTPAEPRLGQIQSPSGGGNDTENPSIKIRSCKLSANTTQLLYVFYEIFENYKNYRKLQFVEFVWCTSLLYKDDIRIRLFIILKDKFC